MPKKVSSRLAPSLGGVGAQLAPVTIESAAAAYAAQFAERYVPEFYRTAITDRLASSIGVGTYLGECTDEDDAAYTDVITTAIASGVNLIDTAINYRCQRSERAVGAALQRSLGRGTSRDAIIICTK